MPPNNQFHPVLATVGKGRRVSIHADVRKEITWPEELPERLLVKVLGAGALRLLSPAATQHKEAEWAKLGSTEALEARERLMTDQRSYVWVRFEKEGFRIYLIQELLPVMRFPLKEDLDERVYMQAAADGDVFIYSIDGYLGHFKN